MKTIGGRKNLIPSVYKFCMTTSNVESWRASGPKNAKCDAFFVVCRLNLLETILSSTEKRIIVTHGTDTLIETGIWLEKKLGGPTKNQIYSMENQI